MTRTIRIIRPASREAGNLLLDRLAEFENLGFEVLYDEMLPDPSWPFSAAPIQARLKALEQALLEKDSQLVWCARGGYGVSDLLPLLNWQKLSTAKPKLVIGFSDISALHSALFTKLGWLGLHAPMPATTLWGKDDNRDDLKAVFAVLAGPSTSSEISIKPVRPTDKGKILEGKLFGGCFSVLTNLIGTPYFPDPKHIEILFIEDTDENPGRLTRYLNQWLQSGALQFTKAVVLGEFRNCVNQPGDAQLHIFEQFAKRLSIPVYRSRDFGHVSPNFPLLIGAHAQLDDHQLNWQTKDSQPLLA